MRTVFCLLALVLAAPLAGAQALDPNIARPSTTLDRQLATLDDPAELTLMAGAAAAQEDIPALISVMTRLVELRPHVGNFRYELAANLALLDRKSATYTQLIELQKQGYGYLLKNDPRFGKVADTDAYQFIADALATNTEPFGEVRSRVILPESSELVEALVWDPTRKALLVGNARDGAIQIVGPNGGLKTLVAGGSNGMWAVFDLAIDVKRGLIWVASSAIPHFRDFDPAKDTGRAGVFAFDLKTGEPRARHLSPEIAGETFMLTNIAVSPDGTVFAVDPLHDAVYRIDTAGLKRLFHAPKLTTIRDIAISPDGRRLYIADNELGLIGYDLAVGKPFDVRVPKFLALSGISGLVMDGNALVVVQDSMSPKRVMRLDLAADGRSVALATPVVAGQTMMTRPTAIEAADGKFVVIANSQKNAYSQDGVLKNPAERERIRLVEFEAAAPPASPAKPAQ